MLGWSCPGGIPMRCRLATAFTNPLFDWASPLLPPGSAENVSRLFQALTNAKATWWCKNRFWCQHIDLHPRFAVDIRALCNAAAVINTPSPHLDALLKKHASSLKLRITSLGPRSIRVRSTSPNFPPSHLSRVIGLPTSFVRGPDACCCSKFPGPAMTAKALKMLRS